MKAEHLIAIYLFIVFNLLSCKVQQNSIDQPFLDNLRHLIQVGAWDQALLEGDSTLKVLKVDSLKNRKMIAAVHYELGRTEINRQDFSKANYHRTEATKIYESLKLYPNLADCWNLFGDIKWYQRDFQRADELYDTAITIYQVKPDNFHPNTGGLYEDRGYTRMQLGNYEGSKEDYDFALKFNRHFFGDYHPKTMVSYNYLGTYYKVVGEYYKALFNLEKAIRIAKEINETPTPNEGSIHANLGVTFYSMGYYSKAMESFEQARAIYELFLPKQHPMKIQIFQALLEGYSMLGSTEETYIYADSLLPYLAENPALESTINYAYARHHHFHQRYDDAISNTKQAIAIMSASGVDERGLYSEKGKMFYLLSGLYVLTEDWGKVDEALDSSRFHYGTAVSSVKELQLKLDLIESATLEGLGEYQQSLKGYTEIIEATAFETQEFDSLTYPRIFELAQRNLATYWYSKYKRTNQLEDGLAAYKNHQILAAYNDYQKQQYFNSETRLILQDYSFDIYTNLSLIAESLYKKTNEPDYLAEAFSYVEKSKNQLMLEQWRLYAQPLQQSLFDSLQLVRVGISFYQQQIENARSDKSNIDNRSLISWQEDLQSLKGEEVFLLEELQAKYKERENESSLNNPVSLSKVQKQLSEQETLIQYQLGAKNLLIYVINKDEIELVKQSLNFPLEQWVDSLRLAIQLPFVSSKMPSDAAWTNSSKQLVEYAMKLYSKLIVPISIPLKKELIFIPDGILGLLPFEVLISEAADLPIYLRSHKYLIKNHDISYAYSAAVQSEMRLKYYETSPSNLYLGLAPFSSNMIEGDENSIVETRKGGGSLLPESEREIKLIYELFNRKGEIWVNEEATKKRFLEGSDQYRIIHLATHAEIDFSLNKSFIEFFPSGDAQLLLNDLYGIRLNADMVVLSACSTGLGEIQKGEGINSLARAFTFCGAKSILATLWNVNDFQTQTIILDYYENLLNDKLSKNLALNKAKRTFIENTTGFEAHPYYWSSLVLIGDTTPIEK